MSEAKRKQPGDVIFRRVRGRVIPIRVNKKPRSIKRTKGSFQREATTALAFGAAAVGLAFGGTKAAVNFTKLSKRFSSAGRALVEGAKRTSNAALQRKRIKQAANFTKKTRLNINRAKKISRATSFGAATLTGIGAAQLVPDDAFRIENQKIVESSVGAVTGAAVDILLYKSIKKKAFPFLK